MFVLMAVSLYTSRVILQVLGVEDYGTYNLVAGFVTLFSFISNALISSTQRFFNVALGESDQQKYKSVYSTSINIMIFFSVIILLVGETLGLWFIKTQINVPTDRAYAAEWVFHISLLTFVVNIIRTTFNASIIAHERMSFYAYTSIFEAIARLGIVYCIQLVHWDKLITYAWLYFTVSLLMSVVNGWYCRHKFEECRYSAKPDKKCFKELLGFSSWALLGQSAVVVRNQGESILINRFFSVVANAALGVANQVTGALDMFVSNFQTAFRPQIVKTYAANEMEQHYVLVCRSSKFSYFLLLILSLPIIFNIDFILGLWLETVPQYVNLFCIFIITSHMLDAISSPLTTSIYASGNIKRYQICFSLVFVVGLLGSFICLSNGCLPHVITIVGICVQLVILCVRLYFVHKVSGLSISAYVRKTLYPAIMVTCVGFVIVKIISILDIENVIISLFTILFEALVLIILVGLLGLTKTEQEYVNSILNSFFNRKK